MTFEAVVGQNAPQVRMIGKEDAVHVPDFSFVPDNGGITLRLLTLRTYFWNNKVNRLTCLSSSPIGAREDAADGVNGSLLVRVSTDTNSLVESD